MLHMRVFSHGTKKSLSSPLPLFFTIYDLKFTQEFCVGGHEQARPKRTYIRSMGVFMNREDVREIIFLRANKSGIAADRAGR